MIFNINFHVFMAKSMWPVGFVSALLWCFGGPK
jgi:hypothetical protein